MVKPENSPDEYKCEKCDSVFKTKQGYKLHITHKTCEAVLTCVRCPLKFKTKAGLLSHARKHERIYDEDVVCRYCKHKTTFKSKALWMVHFEDHHQEVAEEIKEQERKQLELKLKRDEKQRKEFAKAQEELIDQPQFRPTEYRPTTSYERYYTFPPDSFLSPINSRRSPDPLPDIASYFDTS